MVTLQSEFCMQLFPTTDMQSKVTKGIKEIKGLGSVLQRLWCMNIEGSHLNTQDIRKLVKYIHMVFCLPYLM